ncbi:MAG: PepSY domain-containing protein [Pseudomonadales bacterium]|nr:PepSY domain-containing protein [Pseudomonadales bacterium]
MTGLLVLSPVYPAWSQDIPNQVEQNQLDRANPLRDLRGPQANTRINRQQAVNLARQRFAGNILRISVVGEGPNQRYQIRMENEGKVFTVFVHAITGEVSGGA